MAHPEPVPSESKHPASYGFSRRMRLTTSSLFDAVYQARTSRTMGPLTIYALPNELDHLRLGLSIPRRVGGAVRRNLIKRRLREAFRLMQSDLPTGYDLVINVRPHDPVALAEYQRLLAKAARGLHISWTNRHENKSHSVSEPDAQ